MNDEGVSADWNHTDLIRTQIIDTFGPMLFTPAEKDALAPPDAPWPSVNALRQLGKRVIVYGDRVNRSDCVFPPLTVPTWDRDTVQYFHDYPQCGGYGPGDWANFGGESQVVGPLYNGVCSLLINLDLCSEYSACLFYHL